MTPDTDQRNKLVEWSDEANGLVICGTRVPLSELWDTLRAGRSFKDFLHAHEDLPVQPVLRILQAAGERLYAWPWDSGEKQMVTYAKALTEGDLRFASGLVVFLPGVRGGKLLSHPSLNRVDILWRCIEDGVTFQQICGWYPVEPEQLAKLVILASQLFEKVLVQRDASRLPGRGHSDSGQGED